MEAHAEYTPTHPQESLHPDLVIASGNLRRAAEAGAQGAVVLFLFKGEDPAPPGFDTPVPIPTHNIVLTAAQAVTLRDQLIRETEGQ